MTVLLVVYATGAAVTAVGILAASALVVAATHHRWRRDDTCAVVGLVARWALVWPLTWAGVAWRAICR